MEKEKQEKSKEEFILDVAKKVIEERGFSSTRMDDIAQRANVAKGTLYLYFKSKDDLFLRLMDREYSKVLSGLMRVIEKEDDVITKIDAVIEGFLRYMEENRSFFLNIMFEAPSIKRETMKGKMLEKNRLINEGLSRLIKKGIDEGVIRDDIELPVMISAIIGTVSRVIFYAIHFEKDRSLITFKDSILKVIFSGILKEKGGILW